MLSLGSHGLMGASAPAETAGDALDALLSASAAADSSAMRRDEASLVCAVCRDGEWDDENEIIVCEDCSAAAHLTCYGVLSVPDGAWRCHACAWRRGGGAAASSSSSSSSGAAVTCLICQRGGGLLKPLTVSESPSLSSAAGEPPAAWAHMLCALTSSAVVVRRAPLLDQLALAPGVQPLLSGDGRASCSFCDRGSPVAGGVLRCAAAGCRASFHAMCAADAGCRLDLCVRPADGADRRAYCSAHQAKAASCARGDGFDENDVLGIFNGVGAAAAMFARVRAAARHGAQSRTHHFSCARTHTRRHRQLARVAVQVGVWRRRRWNNVGGGGAGGGNASRPRSNLGR